MTALQVNQRQINKIDHTQSINSHVNCYGIQAKQQSRLQTTRKFGWQKQIKIAASVSKLDCAYPMAEWKAIKHKTKVVVEF